jgi:hypothetical protein
MKRSGWAACQRWQVRARATSKPAGHGAGVYFRTGGLASKLPVPRLAGMVGVDRAGLLRSRREASGPTAAAFRTTDMRKILLSLVAIFGMGTAGFAQETLRGIYAPPGPAWPTAPGAGKSGKASKPTLETPNYGPVDGGPAVTISGTVGQGTQLPSDVSPTPIPGRPGYGAAIVNGHRAIVDLNSNSVIQYSQ